MVNQNKQFPFELTTDDVETIQETMAILTNQFLPIRNQVGDATSISTSSSPHSIEIEEFQMQMSISAASHNTNFACNTSELERFPIFLHVNQN